MLLQPACAALGAVAMLLFAAPAAEAKPKPDPEPVPKPTCNLVVDPIGDATLRSTNLDVVSGDVASHLVYVTAVVRVASLAPGDPATAAGARWDFELFVNGGHYRFTGRREATGAVSGELSRDLSGTWFTVALAKVHVDASRNEVRMHAPRSAFRELHPDVLGEATFHGLTITTYAGTGESVRADLAMSPIKYVDGTPSCVKPGA